MTPGLNEDLDTPVTIGPVPHLEHRKTDIQAYPPRSFTIESSTVSELVASVPTGTVWSRREPEV